KASLHGVLTHSPVAPPQGTPACLTQWVARQVSAPLQNRPSSHDAPSAFAVLQSAPQHEAPRPFAAPSSHSSPASTTPLPHTGAGSHAGRVGSTTTVAAGVAVPETVGWPLRTRSSFLTRANRLPLTVIWSLERKITMPRSIPGRSPRASRRAAAATFTLQAL